MYNEAKVFLLCTAVLCPDMISLKESSFSIDFLYPYFWLVSVHIQVFFHVSRSTYNCNTLEFSNQALVPCVPHFKHVPQYWICGRYLTNIYCINWFVGRTEGVRPRTKAGSSQRSGLCLPSDTAGFHVVAWKMLITDIHRITQISFLLHIISKWPYSRVRNVLFWEFLSSLKFC